MIIDSKTIKKICEIAKCCYDLGWDERNGGNISVLVDESEIQAVLADANPIGRINTEVDTSALEGKLLLVTGTGKYFRNIPNEPSQSLGIIRLGKNGFADIVWGFENSGKPTSELPTHILAHKARLAADESHRVVIHSHPTNVIAMTFTHALESKSFTLSLWRMITESLVVFPDGVSLLDWMICGNKEIGIKSAELLKECRSVIWAHHGILCTGSNLDETFGLVETIEKSAELYMKTLGYRITEGITDDRLRELASAFGVTPRKNYL